MKNLEKMFDEALDIVKTTIGEDKVEYIYRPITINKRARRWGSCTSSIDGRHRIEISDKLLDDGVSYDATMNTLIHEILHACKNGQSHKGMWKIYANKINSKHPQFNIKRTTSYAEKGIEIPETVKKYAVECEKCGFTHYGQRMSKLFKMPERYSHNNCGGHFKRVF